MTAIADDLRLARHLTALALRDVEDIRRRAAALTTQTRWRARAADAYRDAAGDWVGAIDRLARAVEDFERRLVEAERAERSAATAVPAGTEP